MTEKLDIYVLGFQGHMWTLYTVSHVIQQHFQFSPQLAWSTLYTNVCQILDSNSNKTQSLPQSEITGSHSLC